MRHRKKHGKLSMMRSHRKATLRNMVKSLFKHQKIETIHARAKEARRLAESLITLARTDDVASRRRAFAILTDRDLVGKLFKEIVPLFKDRKSGYTRIIPIGFRRGDGASLCILELTEKKIVEKLPKKKKEKAKAAEPKAGAAPEAKQDAKAEEHKIKQAQKTKPLLEEEKKHEKAKSEDRKAADHKGFMKNLRGLFRKRGDR